MKHHRCFKAHHMDGRIRLAIDRHRMVLLHRYGRDQKIVELSNNI